MENSRLSIASIADQSSNAGNAQRGLFSSTLFPSSSVQTILSAQLVAKGKWDVIFVRRHHVTFKELVVEETTTIGDYYGAEEGANEDRTYEQRHLDDCRLDTAFEKSDFDSVITGAKILQISGPIPDRTVPGIGQNERGWQETFESNPFPPHVLVLTLRRDKLDSLALLFASDQTGARHARLGMYQRRLPQPNMESAGSGQPEFREAPRLGSHLAVEPLGRAIAVAAQESRLMLYKLRPRKHWQRAISATYGASNAPFEPFEEERDVKIVGRILKLDFLRPDKSDTDRAVILLAIVDTGDNNTKLRRWDWDTTQPLSDGLTEAWPNGYPVHGRLTSPHLLIPSVADSGFWLLSDKTLARYSSVMTGQPTVKVRALNYTTENSHDMAYGSISRNRKKWTVYARPYRPGWGERYTDESDLLYLGREDGQIQYIELGVGTDIDIRTPMNMNIPPIWMDKANDTAFAVLPYGGGAIELVVAACGLFCIKPREDFKCLQLFDDWTPVQDFCLRNQSVLCLNATSSDQIMSLVSGHRARPWTQVGLQQNDYKRLWLLYCGQTAMIVSTFESRTHLDFVDLRSADHVNVSSTSESSSLMRDMDELFDQEAETVLAGQCEDGLTVQVTPFYIRAASGKGTLQTIENSGTIAACAMDYQSADLMVAGHDTLGPYLAIWHRVQPSGQSSLEQPLYRLGQRHDLQADVRPSSTGIAILSRVDTSVGALSTWDHGVLLIHTKSDSTTMTVRALAAGVCDSIALTWVDGLIATLGLRTGSVEMIRVDEVKGENHRASEALGRGSVQVLEVSGNTLALCDGRLFKLEIGLQEQVVFKRSVVMSTDPQNGHGVGLENGPQLKDIIRLPFWASRPQFALLTADNSLSMITSVGRLETICDKASIFRFKRQEIVPDQQYTIRQMTGMMPFKNVLAISYKQIALIKAPERSSTGPKNRRLTYTMLGFYDPVTRALLTDEKSQKVHKQSGAKYRRQFQWSADISGRKFQLVVVHTETLSKSTKPNSPQPSDSGRGLGRGLIYRVDFKGPDIKATEKVKLKRTFPIDYIAEYGPDSLILAYGSGFENAKLEVITLQVKADENEKFQWTARDVRLEVGPKKFTSLYIKKTASNDTLIHATSENKLFIIDEQNRRQWDSNYYRDMGEIHEVSDGIIPIVLVLSSDGILGFTYNKMTPPGDGGRIRRDDLWVLFEAKSQTPISAALPSCESWFVGSSSAGSFRQFKVIQEQEWRLLRYIQNLAEQNKSVCPFSYEDRLEPPTQKGPEDRYLKSPLDPARAWSRMRTHAMHIDGDLLRRVPAHLLEGELIPHAKPHRSERSLRTFEERLALLQELAQNVSVELIQDRMFERITEWVRTFWEPRI